MSERAEVHGLARLREVLDATVEVQALTEEEVRFRERLRRIIDAGIEFSESRRRK